MGILSGIAVVFAPIMMLIVLSGLVDLWSFTSGRHECAPLSSIDDTYLEERSVKVGVLIRTVLNCYGTKHREIDEDGRPYEYLDFEDSNFRIGKGYLSIATTGERVFDIEKNKIIQDGPWVEKFCKTYSKI